MILFEVRNYLRASGVTPLRDLAAHFELSEDSVKQMVEHWERKGAVRKLPEGSLCQGSCQSCSPDTIELYEWVE